MNDHFDHRCAVIGNPIEHSLSPQIHTHFAKQFGMSLNYEKILASAENFQEVVGKFFNEGGKGLNITTPFKEMAYNMCDHSCAMSHAAQSCNTLYMSGHELHGTTTDGEGWLADLKRLDFDFKQSTLLLFGAGGANRILYHTLLQNADSLGYESIIWANRSVEKLHHQIDNPRVTKVGLDSIPKHDYNLVINGISVGWQNQFPALDVELTKSCFIYDLNYGQGAKPFHDWAIQQGANKSRCIDGWGMLVGQAARSFNIWWQKMPQTQSLIEYGISV